jgi:hypothetical protein
MRTGGRQSNEENPMGLENTNEPKQNNKYVFKKAHSAYREELHLVLVDFKQQLVVNLQHHPRPHLARTHRTSDVHHRLLRDVSRRALTDRVARLALSSALGFEVSGIDVG